MITTILGGRSAGALIAAAGPCCQTMSRGGPIWVVAKAVRTLMAVRIAALGYR